MVAYFIIVLRRSKGLSFLEKATTVWGRGASWASIWIDLLYLVRCCSSEEPRFAAAACQGFKNVTVGQICFKMVRKMNFRANLAIITMALVHAQSGRIAIILCNASSRSTAKKVFLNDFYFLFVSEPPCSQPKQIDHGITDWDGRSSFAKYACFQGFHLVGPPSG